MLRLNIEAFWEDVLQQNRDRLADWFCPDAVIRWHCTNEQFTVPEFIQQYIRSLVNIRLFLL